jgi:hypothetical protein
MPRISTEIDSSKGSLRYRIRRHERSQPQALRFSKLTRRTQSTDLSDASGCFDSVIPTKEGSRSPGASSVIA